MKFCPQCGNQLVTRYLHGHDRPACPTCSFVHYAGPKVAVGVVIARDGQILLNRRAIDPGKGLWSFPSGYVDLGESTASSAVRDVKEETGYEVALCGLVGVYSTESRPVIFIVYAGELIGGELIPSDEVEEVRLFATDDLPTFAFEHDSQIVRDWQTWLSSTIRTTW